MDKQSWNVSGYCFFVVLVEQRVASNRSIVRETANRQGPEQRGMTLSMVELNLHGGPLSRHAMIER